MTQVGELVEIGRLLDEGAIIAMQDGNHGEKHPKASAFSESGIPFIMANNIQDYRVDIEGSYKIPQQLADSLRIGFSIVGDVLLTHKGTIGNTAIVDRADPYIMLTPQVTYYRTNPKKLLNYYLMYAFQDPLFQKTMKSLAQQSTRPYIGITAQRRLKIKYRNLSEQISIVEILKAYDDLIENNRRRIQLLEQAARLLNKEWFVYLRFPGHEHAKIKDGVPEGWKRKTLGALCEEIRESVSPDALEPDTPYIGLEHMPRRSITLNEWGKTEQVTSSKHRFREGEILFGKIRPYFHKVGIALVDGIASSDAIVIRPKEDKLRGFVLLTVSSDGFVALTAQTMKEGSKMPRADWKQMQQYIVPLPPDGLLSTFNSVIETILKQLKSLSFGNRNLIVARDLLLPRLMNGEIAI